MEETFNYVRTMPIYRMFTAMNPTPEDISSFLRSYQKKFSKISIDEIYYRDLQFLNEGLQLMNNILTESERIAFMDGFESSYNR